MNKTMMFLGMLAVGFANAQQNDPYEGRVGVNTDTPKATLDVKSIGTDQAKGILTPQLTGDEVKTMTTNLTVDQHGMVTFAKNGVTTPDSSTNNVQFTGYHRFNMVGSEKSWVRLEPSGLEKIKGEGDKIGWALIGRDATKYGSIGLKSIDISAVNSDAKAGVTMGATGNHSFATGLNTSASGWNSTTMGNGTIASGNSATALGEKTTASGNLSIATGKSTTASGWGSTAMGVGTTASGSTSTALGEKTTASGNLSIATGKSTTASGWGSTAMGVETTASGSASIALGQGTKAIGEYSFASGKNTTASGQGSIAMGIEATASGWNSISIGEETIASQNNAVAMGNRTEASGVRSFAVGNANKAKGYASVAMGYNTIATTDHETVVGSYNTETTSTTLEGKNRLFVVGNGSGEVLPDGNETRSDALTVLRNGKVGIDIDNFENTTSDAKLQVNGKILANSLAGAGDRIVYADKDGVLKVGATNSTTNNSSVKMGSGAGVRCEEATIGTINFGEITVGGEKRQAFGFCTKDANGTPIWAYMVAGNHMFSSSNPEFGKGLN